MARRYAISSNMGGSAVSASFKTNLSLISTTAIRPKIYEWDFGTIGTPVDAPCQVALARETVMTAGTNNTSVTPNPVDPADPAATATSGGAWTTEPTIGVVLFNTGINARATYRWIAAPGGELVCPATAQAGVGLRVLSPTYAADAESTIYYEE